MNAVVDPGTRVIGTDLRVGALGYGCWRLVAMSAQTATGCIEAAIANGMNLIDTADVYGLDWGGSAFGEAEVVLGQVLNNQPRLREQMVLASKGGITPGIPYDSSDLIGLCEASLKRLQTEHIDLYQIHRPDPLTHPEQVAAQLTALRTSGKIREVGVSNHRPDQTLALQQFLDFPIASQQPEYSAIHLDPLFDGTFDLSLRQGQQIISWSPLAGGALATGEGVAPDLLEVLDELARREQVSRSSIALAFALAHPTNPIALVGSINEQRIGQASEALGVQLSRQDVYRIIESSLGEALP